MLKNPDLADFGFDNGGFSAKLTAELANHYLLEREGGGVASASHIVFEGFWLKVEFKNGTLCIWHEWVLLSCSS